MSDALWDVVVVGAGAAGLMAAISAAEHGARVLILEKNRKAGCQDSHVGRHTLQCHPCHR